MDTKEADDRDVESVLLRALDRRASDDDLAWLNQTLAADEAARRVACDFLVDEALLADDADAEGQARALKDLVLQKESPKPTPASDAWWRAPLRFVDHHGLFVAAIAAGLLVALGVQYLATMRKMDRLHSLALVGPPEEAAGGSQVADDQRRWLPEAAPTPVVGRVTGLEDVRWEAGQTELAFGDSLPEGGSVHLESGVVELLLTTGAKVTIEGPARFEANSVSESSLNLGRIAAAVPRAGRGYTILTPTSEVIDLGTRFGVNVEETGETELHVFDGDVVAKSRLVNAAPTYSHAIQDQAMRFDAKSDKPKRFAARTEDFVRSLGTLHEAGDLPPLPVSRSLCLWYAADVMPKVKDGDAVTTWRDLLVGDNDFADDAWQFDARRAPVKEIDAQGRHAVRFDGWSTYLETSPMETGDRQTIFIAYAPGPTSFANDHHGGILLKYPTAPSIELSVHADRSVRGWVWPGHGSDGNVAEITGQPTGELEPCAVAYEYDSLTGDEGVARLWLNGVLQGQATAPVPVHQTSQRVLGSHSDLAFKAFYFGKVYEVLIFDDTLTDEERGELTRYLVDRHQIDFDS